MEATYLISIYFTESGPYTLEQLGRMARERRFSWAHYVQKTEGDNKWLPPWDVGEVKNVLNKRFTFMQGDTGPTGGMVFFHNNGLEDLILEAAPHNLGPVPAKEAEKLCSDYNGGGFTDWRIPDEDELRAFSVAYFKEHISGKYDATVLLWAFSKHNCNFNAIVTKEHRNTWSPWDHQANNNKYRIGSIVQTDEASPLQVRPVRLIKAQPHSEGQIKK